MTARSKDDLVSQHGACDYFVRIQNSVQVSLSKKFSLIGKYSYNVIWNTLLFLNVYLKVKLSLFN